MEDGNSSSSGGDNSSNKNTVAENSEETIHINIKTLNSNVSTLLVGKKVFYFYNLCIFTKLQCFFGCSIYFGNLTIVCSEKRYTGI